MSTLREIQTAIHNSLLHNDSDAALAFINSGSLSAPERLNIYRNTHIGSLIAALKLMFPAVCKIVGESFFEAAADIFVREHPPTSAYLHDYGDEFPQFLEEFGPAAELKYLRDVADLDWATNRAIHAPDIEPIDRARIVDVPPIDQGRISFVPHPSITLLHVTFSADEIWRAVLEADDQAMADVDLRESPVWLLVERYEGEVRIVRLSDTAAWFAAHVFSGKSLQMALESSGDEAPVFLADHLAHGRFADMKLLDLEMTH